MRGQEEEAMSEKDMWAREKAAEKVAQELVEGDKIMLFDGHQNINIKDETQITLHMSGWEIRDNKRAFSAFRNLNKIYISKEWVIKGKRILNEDVSAVLLAVSQCLPTVPGMYLFKFQLTKTETDTLCSMAQLRELKLGNHGIR